MIDLFIGLLAGFWIWGMRALAKGGTIFFSKKPGRKNRWLAFIGGSAWKVLAIGVGFAVFMQVPIINRFLQIITFEILGLNWFLRSIVLAFEIGFLPAWLESAIKTILAIKYEKKVLEAKAGTQIARQMARS